ncbi:hypothetical protein JW851_03120 [Candidatus Woesearchaeota archaeon]|nr:hypothetical protein [Candidatus Woesearchaeota archaeon]
MVLRITDRPKFVENQVRIDPYETTLAAITSKNYKKCAQILKGKIGVRERASVPTVLLHISPRQYAELIEEIKRFSAEKELFSCFNVAQRISRDFDDFRSQSEIERILTNVPLNELPKLLPYVEFKHIYEVYRHHHEPRPLA